MLEYFCNINQATWMECNPLASSIPVERLTSSENKVTMANKFKSLEQFREARLS